MPWYSEEQIEEVRSRSDIVSVIGRYVRLKRTGSGYTGLCPFHNEKTPSFHVNPASCCIFYGSGDRNRQYGSSGVCGGSRSAYGFSGI